LASALIEQLLQQPATPTGGRSRAASVSVGPARPTFSIEDIQSGKIKAPTPSKDGKKKNPFKEQNVAAKKPTKDASARPSIMDAGLFAPPRAGTPKPPPELTDADNSGAISSLVLL